MKTQEQQRRLQPEDDLVERASRVIQDSRELVQERLAHAATLEQLIMRRDNIARETLLGDNR